MGGIHLSFSQAFHTTNDYDTVHLSIAILKIDKLSGYAMCMA